MSTRRLHWALSVVLLSTFSLGGAGCGDEPKKASRRGSGAPKHKKKHKGPVRGAAPDLSKLPAKFQNAKWETATMDPQVLREARDPFHPYVDDLLPKPADETNNSAAIAPEGVVSDSEVTELQLIAIITGGAVAKAMLTDSRGLGHMLRVGDIVGLKEPYRVARITRNEVLFRPLRSNPDEPLEDVTKVLLTQDELQELRP